MPFVTLAAMAAAQVFIPRPVPGHIPPPASTGTRSLLTWTPGDVRCDQGVATGQALRRPLAHMYWGPLPSPSFAPGPALRPGVLRFDIDDTGRPLSIRQEGQSTPSAPDLAPALAASRFAAAGKRTGCTITDTPRVTPLDQAPVADLIAYTLSPETGPLPQEGWARIRREGDCTDQPMPQPLLRALPDFRKLPATPG